jgi:outer membrane protein OmpA-like peptidoglycan-associated protein
MKRQPRILAGTALGLLMASAPLGAFPLSAQPLAARATEAPLILAQAECEGEACPPEQAPAAEEQKTRQERRKERRQQQQEQQQAPAAEEQQPRQERRKERREQQEQQAPAAEERQAPAAEEQQPRQERRKERRQQQEQQAPAAEEQQAPAAEEQQPRQERRKERRQQQEEQQAPAAQTPAEEAPAQEAPAQERQGEQPQGEQPSTGQPSAEQPGEGQPPATGEQPSEQGERPTRRGERQGEQPDGQPAQQGEQSGEAPADPNAAPILDSQKETAPAAEPGQQPALEGEQPAQTGERQRRQRDRQQGEQQGEQAAQPQPPADQGPPPESDAAAQATMRPEQIQPLTSEEGRRIEVGTSREERQRFREERRERHQDTRVVEEFNDNRTIIQINNHTYIDSPDYTRIIRDRDDVYYDELPRGRIREVVTRPNGVRIVTIRNRYGDVIRRSRIEPDNREVILVYVEDDYEDRGVWHDPGLDLPPMRLTIPREEYILDAEYVDEPDDYYEFLEQPPVERVERTYSLTEVKRSARIRDKVRRIDMDTLTFEFGSASIAESEIPKLEGVANAMQKLLEKNPAETFLLEGHTDAVGSDNANLALSDKRAEAVAEALTNVFDIPPENLATQGYGEQYLKVNTQARERENRRVAIRRVTPLVAPVASAN